MKPVRWFYSNTFDATKNEAEHFPYFSDFCLFYICEVTSALQSGRIGADEEIDDFKGRSAEEVEEIKAEKEAKTQAILLEMVR